MIKNNKSILSIYVFLFALGITGLIGLSLTLLGNVKIKRGAEIISYSLLLIPLLFTFFLIFINENNKLENTPNLNLIQRINKIIYLIKEVIKNNSVGIFIMLEIIIGLVLAIDHMDYYWLGNMTTPLKVLHILIVVLLTHQMYKYNKYIYKSLFSMDGESKLSMKFIIEMVASISLCITALSGVYVYFNKFKTGDADIREDKILN
jgi:hypothetical protein